MKTASYKDSLSATLMQVKFLLSQAPMIQLDASMMSRSVTPFAYTNPNTFFGLTRNYSQHGRGVYTVSPSPTRWILTEHVPEGHVIFSPNPMPNFRGQS